MCKHRLFQSVERDGRTNVTGAGDTMVGTALWWLHHSDKGCLVDAVYGGTITAAAAVLEGDYAVCIQHTC